MKQFAKCIDNSYPLYKEFEVGKTYSYEEGMHYGVVNISVNLTEHIVKKLSPKEFKSHFEPISKTVMHPSHYQGKGMEVLDVAAAFFNKEKRIGFYVINALKYLLRYDKKNGIEDLEKLQFYIDELIKLEKAKSNVNNSSEGITDLFYGWKIGDKATVVHGDGYVKNGDTVEVISLYPDTGFPSKVKSINDGRERYAHIEGQPNPHNTIVVTRYTENLGDSND